MPEIDITSMYTVTTPELPDPSTTGCDALADAVDEAQAVVADIDDALQDVDRRLEQVDRWAEQWQGLEHAANQDVIADLASKPVDQSSPAFATWQEKLAVDEAAVRQAHEEGEALRREGDALLEARKRLHEEQERLRRWLDEAQHQRATRCPDATGIGSAPPKKSLVAAGVGIAVTGLALAVGLLSPSSADPEPPAVTPVTAAVTPVGKPAGQAKSPVHWTYLEVKAVTVDGQLAGGGHFTVKTTSDLTQPKPESQDQGDGTFVVSVHPTWEGTISYQPAPGW